jgi:hypothetical protein
LGVAATLPFASITHLEIVHVEFPRGSAIAQYLHKNPDFLQSLATESALAIVSWLINRY